VILGDKTPGASKALRRPEEDMDWKYLLTSFEGRISRQPFWLSVLALFIAQWVIMLILGMVFGYSMMGGMDPGMASSGMAPIVIVSLLFLYPALAVYTKRWHDRGKSGWWTLILLVPLIGFIWFLVECGFLRGTDGPNQYGNDPLA
jgi:uncharacterized membrane protein YhaH (DUF805 family)